MEDILNYVENPELVKKDVVEEQSVIEETIVETVKEHKILDDYKISKMKLSKKCLRFYSDANIETVGDFLLADKDTFDTYDTYKKKYLEDVLTILREDGYDL
jgi:DNA-directed RNA polymerase alpha subunit